MNAKTDINKVFSRVIKRKLPLHHRADAKRLAKLLEIQEFKQGNFTIITLSVGASIQGVGVSKRMPNDVADDVIGYNLALVKAVEAVIQKNYLAA